MARIADEELEHIKSQLSLQRLVESSGVALKRHGNDLIGHCPFHDDKTPSLIVTPAKNLWHCLGACQCGGSVIDWVMKRDKVSFRHAVELLRQDATLMAQSPVTPRDTDLSTLPPLVTEDADKQATLSRVVQFYHATLQQSPEALDYLAKRGINHPEAISYFQLGYANRTLGYRLPSSNTQEGTKLRKQLQQFGILRDSGHEHFSGSIIIPVQDEKGLITEIYGRKILGNRLRKGTPQHTYLPGPHHGVFNIAAFKASGEIICKRSS